MKTSLLKGGWPRWTMLGLVLVVLSVLVFTFWIGTTEVITLSQRLTALPWGWWRGLGYGALCLVWPWLIQLLTRQKQRKVSRIPLLVLIVLYEGVIVHNPLSVLLHWWR